MGDLYADDLVIIADSMEECVRLLLTWNEGTEEDQNHYLWYRSQAGSHVSSDTPV